MLVHDLLPRPCSVQVELLVCNLSSINIHASNKKIWPYFSMFKQLPSANQIIKVSDLFHNLSFCPKGQSNLELADYQFVSQPYLL